jgi:hypothetical protein
MTGPGSPWLGTNQQYRKFKTLRFHAPDLRDRDRDGYGHLCTQRKHPELAITPV